MLAEALAATYDVNLAVTARAADLVEAQAVEWVAEFVGYPCAEGAFTSGGMISNLTGLIVARERALPGCRHEGFAGRQGAVYCSEEAHHSIVRAVEAGGHRLGLRPHGSRSTSCRRIRVDELDRGDRRRRRGGRDAGRGSRQRWHDADRRGRPDRGGRRRLRAPRRLASRRRCLWAARGGDRDAPAPLFAGVERADSVTLDAHKWLGLQKSCSLILCRHAGAFEAAFGHEESYMRRGDSVRNAVERTLEYSRPLRSLKLWLAFRTHGAAAFRGWIESTLALAQRFADEVRADEAFELLCEPTLSTVCFRHVAGRHRPRRPQHGARDARSRTTAASSSRRRWSTTRSACGCASSTSAPGPRTSTSSWKRCGSSARVAPLSAFRAAGRALLGRGKRFVASRFVKGLAGRVLR